MYHVMVVEDEVWIRNGIVEMVERLGTGFKVVAQAGNGREAWNLINEVWPNVIITDIVMPEWDGLELLRKCDEYKLSIVPIVISGFENFSYAQRAIRYGATEYLLKPVVAEELQSALTRSVERMQSFLPVQEALLAIQEYMGVLEVWGHQKLVHEAARILDHIYKIKVANPGVKFGLLRLFYDKLNDHIHSVNPGHQRSEQPDVKDKVAVNNDVVRCLEQLSRHLNQPQAGKKQRALSKSVAEYVRQNYAKEITLSQMAEYSDLSVSRFCVLFKQQYGDSFINYLNDYRIGVAKQLLLEQDLKVYEIADMVGFSSLPYFNRLFKSQLGQSPNEYRRSLGI